MDFVASKANLPKEDIVSVEIAKIPVYFVTTKDGNVSIIHDDLTFGNIPLTVVPKNATHETLHELPIGE